MMSFILSHDQLRMTLLLKKQAKREGHDRIAAESPGDAQL